MTQHMFPGLRPTPLSSYLAGLGLIRVLGEQADADLTVAWGDGGLVVETTVNDVATWLVDEYAPTPVLSPWNDGSGFGPKDVTPKKTLDKLLASPSRRFEPFRAVYAIASSVAADYRSSTLKKEIAKEQAIREFRNRCPEPLLPWIDATVVLADQTQYPPILGTGGNDGRLEFSTTFHQRLLDVLDEDPKARRRSLAHARDLLEGTQSEGALRGEPIGQFDPAGAGGKNSSPFGDAEPIVNPWTFVLLIEGSLLFASTPARRNLHGARRAAVPFTVVGSPDGSTSGAEGEASRGEVWAPVWTVPCTLPEIVQLFSEARATWRGRPAQRAADFYAATRTLGVARGVATFERYGFHQRNGLAYVAVPLGRVAVQTKPSVRLAGEFEDWVSRVGRIDKSTGIHRALRRFERAHLAFVKDAGPLDLLRMLAAFTDLELAVGRSGRAREGIRAWRDQPSARDFLDVLAEELPETWQAELRVAAGVASCAAQSDSARANGQQGTARTLRTMRQILLPIDPDGKWRDSPIVPGLGARPVYEVLADVLMWRSAMRGAGRAAAVDTESRGGRFRGVPGFERGIPVPAADLHRLASRSLSSDRLEQCLRACLALDWRGVRTEGPQPTDAFVPVSTLCLLHALAAGMTASDEPDAPRLALDPGWAARLTAGQIIAVHRDAGRRLRQAGWKAVAPPPTPTVDGIALAAALVPRCRSPLRVLERYAARRLRVGRNPGDLNAFRGELMNGSRTLLTIELRPIAGTRFQPTGFPDLGAAEFGPPDDRKLLVESAQSMANHLEATTWDEARCDQIGALAGIPYVKILDTDGQFLSSSRLEAHRLASAYIMNGKIDGKKGEDWLAERMQLTVGLPLDTRKVAKVCFALDPLSLIHGVFFARKKWPWQPKIARAVTSFVEASGIEPAVSGGVKRDTVINEAKDGATAEGYGTVPHHRVEYTAKQIKAYVTVDHVQIRSYGLSEAATALLEAIIDLEIGSLFARGLRLRTACDLEVVDVDGTLPDVDAATQRIAQLVPQCASELGQITEAIWSSRGKQ